MQVEHDEASAGAEWHADPLGFSACDGPSARLHQQCNPLGIKLPDRVILQPAMRQGSLRPSRKDEADAAVLIGHILGGGIKHAPVLIFVQKLKRTVLTVLFEQPMYRTHANCFPVSWPAWLQPPTASSWTLAGAGTGKVVVILDISLSR